MQRVVNNMRKGQKRVGRELFPEERRGADEDIIRSAQRESVQEEYKALAGETGHTEKRACKMESTLR